jgi:hypothetical protein
MLTMKLPTLSLTLNQMPIPSIDFTVKAHVPIYLMQLMTFTTISVLVDIPIFGHLKVTKNVWTQTQIYFFLKESA